MRVLVDECCPPAIAFTLAEAGHDVVPVREDFHGYDDDQVAGVARETGRLLVTLDQGFGEKAVRYDMLPNGVLLLRGFGSRGVSEMVVALATVLRDDDRLMRWMTTVDPRGVRKHALS